MWVCRPGQQGKYYDLFLNTNRIYLAWNGYFQDFSGCTTRTEFRETGIAEKNPEARTTISNWAGQLYSFCVEMSFSDYVLIPSKASRTYLLCKVNGAYSSSNVYSGSTELTYCLTA